MSINHIDKALFAELSEQLIVLEYLNICGEPISRSNFLIFIMLNSNPTELNVLAHFSFPPYPLCWVKRFESKALKIMKVGRVNVYILLVYLTLLLITWVQRAAPGIVMALSLPE